MPGPEHLQDSLLAWEKFFNGTIRRLGAFGIFAAEVTAAIDGTPLVTTIARKRQPVGKRVTLFMGLPVPCGTTAHGTAFDKAGKGIADPGGLEAALRYTVMLCPLLEGSLPRTPAACFFQQVAGRVSYLAADDEWSPRSERL